jgi:hypothetical protein
MPDLSVILITEKYPNLEWLVFQPLLEYQTGNQMVNNLSDKLVAENGPTIQFKAR